MVLENENLARDYGNRDRVMGSSEIEPDRVRESIPIRTIPNPNYSASLTSTSASNCLPLAKLRKVYKILKCEEEKNVTDFRLTL